MQGAAGTLKKIPPGRRLVAQLPRCAGQDRLRQEWIFASYFHVGREPAVRHQRADSQSLLRGLFDAAERQRIDVDKIRRRLDFKLHKVDQIGPASDELGCTTRRRRAGGRDITRSLVAKRLHDRSPSTTSRIAATMFAYAEHRQIFPLIRSLISASVSIGWDATSAVA